MIIQDMESTIMALYETRMNKLSTVLYYYVQLCCNKNIDIFFLSIHFDISKYTHFEIFDETPATVA